MLATIQRVVDGLVSHSGRMLLLLSLLEENDRAIQFETAKLLTVLLVRERFMTNLSRVFVMNLMWLCAFTLLDRSMIAALSEYRV